jgi:hypothetical protein
MSKDNNTHTQKHQKKNTTHQTQTQQTFKKKSTEKLVSV